MVIITAKIIGSELFSMGVIGSGIGIGMVVFAVAVGFVLLWVLIARNSTQWRAGYNAVCKD